MGLLNNVMSSPMQLLTVLTWKGSTSFTQSKFFLHMLLECHGIQTPKSAFHATLAMNIKTTPTWNLLKYVHYYKTQLKN